MSGPKWDIRPDQALLNRLWADYMEHMAKPLGPFQKFMGAPRKRTRSQRLRYNVYSAGAAVIYVIAGGLERFALWIELLP